MTQEQIVKEVDNFLQDPVFGKLLNRNAAIVLAQHFHDLAISNQWISVEEKLPPVEKTYNDEESGIFHKWSKWVLIRTHKGGAYLDSYVFHKHIWTNNREDVTHWMEIPPTLKGE